MTTIVWDGKTLAADRQMAGYMTTCKIFPIPNGYLAGAGTMHQLIEVAAWMQEGKDKPALPESEDSEFIVIRGDEAFWLTWPYLREVRIREPFAVIGSGAQFAIGALAMGSDAKTAVKIAAQFDPETGGGIDSVTP
ncbi:hypothetical protein CSC70_03875 [Pseudoxanthomonas kalamensis DSM 18571]|uniref:hypothetical protein n=1 Tax=Pseudoxanthomonas kalamensis TaxID=289483 RepID=UPI0013909BD4|nr:hypothetical protein [Pseudoxanthomonas kalamensis]KAF1711074.1 hypothetical protein CSC70_03875 [Pseudoxanthomonas kalamensis DSM 18571]